jgi:predicted aminopeptidase
LVTHDFWLFGKEVMHQRTSMCLDEKTTVNEVCIQAVETHGIQKQLAATSSR